MHTIATATSRETVPSHSATDREVLAGLDDTQAARANGEGNQDREAPEAAAPTHVLVAEDYPGVAELIRMSLEARGYCVSVADSLAGAVSVAERLRIDLLLTDLRLGDGMGWDLLARIQKMQAVPGIVMSGYSDKAYIDHSKAVGFLEYLVKPLDENELCESVSRVLMQRAEKAVPPLPAQSLIHASPSERPIASSPPVKGVRGIGGPPGQQIRKTS